MVTWCAVPIRGGVRLAVTPRRLPARHTKGERSVRQHRPTRRVRSFLALFVVVAAALGLGACAGQAPPPPPQVIGDKGTPYGDLLVPKLEASVTDGAVGVPVD